MKPPWIFNVEKDAWELPPEAAQRLLDAWDAFMEPLEHHCLHLPASEDGVDALIEKHDRYAKGVK